MIAVRYSRDARRDVEQIEAYYRELDADFAFAIASRIVAATRFLSETPRAGPAMPRGDSRKWRVPRTPYLLFYRVERDCIRVLRVVHGASRAASR